MIRSSLSESLIAILPMSVISAGMFFGSILSLVSVFGGQVSLMPILLELRATSMVESFLPAKMDPIEFFSLAALSLRELSKAVSPLLSSSSETPCELKLSISTN